MHISARAKQILHSNKWDIEEILSKVSERNIKLGIWFRFNFEPIRLQLWKTTDPTNMIQNLPHSNMCTRILNLWLLWIRKINNYVAYAFYLYEIQKIDLKSWFSNTKLIPERFLSLTIKPKKLILSALITIICYLAACGCISNFDQ